MKKEMTNTNKEVFCSLMDYLIKNNLIDEQNYFELENIFLDFYPQYQQANEIRKIKNQIKKQGEKNEI
tara:strand:+ start:217 stop:420 length:204 start_codon:yes stop_codon:yes gene_type:complete